MTAPIAIFAYNRPGHLRRCLESLLANAEASSSDVYVFCDGPRSREDVAAVQEVRAIAEAARGFASLTKVFRADNMGLARSIISGVSDLLEKHDRLIVIEDDLVFAPAFLGYMNSGLDLYADDGEVASIHGYCYPVAESLPETFFLEGADCWGWATWRRAWNVFQPDGVVLLRELEERGLEKEFDLDGAYAFTRMLRDQIVGRNDSWAVRWHASCYLKGMLTLYPGRSLVHNTGNDASGTHSADSPKYDVTLSADSYPVHRIPIEPNGLAREAFIRFLRPTGWDRVRRFCSAIMRRGTASFG